MTAVIAPGAALGVLGSGQLGRMFAIAARRLGYRVHVFSPEADSPTGQIADREVVASYADEAALEDFARQVSVVTFEFENIPFRTTEIVARHAPVRPDGRVLHTTQHRLREKSTLRELGFPVTPFEEVHSEGGLRGAARQLGLPAVLKTAAWGYDGKGQLILREEASIPGAWKQFQTDAAILEAFVDFECELSVVAARGLDGDVVTYGPLRNVHAHHILDVTSYPANLPAAVEAESLRIARDVMTKLDVVGVLCVEFFLARDGRLLINELAPRPHNSGHLTIDACVTCQFEQQVRAICGLPLGSSRWHSAAAMSNLLGDVWESGPPRWDRALADGDVKLHLYGKQEPRAGRKMGHLTALGDTSEAAISRARAARTALRSTAAQHG